LGGPEEGVRQIVFLQALSLTSRRGGSTESAWDCGSAGSQKKRRLVEEKIVVSVC
jgi:hypothetical protein